jgi:hypothetical protein
VDCIPLNPEFIESADDLMKKYHCLVTFAPKG